MSAATPAPPREAPAGPGREARPLFGRLRRVVLGDVFERLARGFVDGRRRRGLAQVDEAALAEVHAATFRLLSRLFFVLHAEARGLLPAHDARGYGAHALEALRREAARRLDAHDPPSPASTAAWERVRALFALLGSGAPEMGLVPLGGPFRPDAEADRFDRENPVSDFFLVHALDRLSRGEEGRFFDYAELEGAQAAALLEPLLEHRLVPGAGGKPVLADTRGEHRAAHERETPAWVAEYMVAEAVGPALAEREAAFRRAAASVAERRARLEGADPAERERMTRELEAAERRAVDDLLSLRVCDPAMGSGRLLAQAGRWIAARLAALAREAPDNPLARRLERTRTAISAGSPSEATLPHATDEELLRRTVARRCLFGVDAGARAVELAKMALWLDTAVAGAPLPYLDAHLKAGSALTGTRLDEVQRAVEESPQGQFDAFGGPFRGLARAAEALRGAAAGEDATPAEVEASAAGYETYAREAAPYRRLLDAWVSRPLGNERADELVRVAAPGVLAAARGEEAALNPAHAGALARAAELAAAHAFFHWDLELPEAFADLERGEWRGGGGFDALLLHPGPERPAAALRPYLARAYADVHEAAAEGAVYLARRALDLLRPGSRMAALLPGRTLRAGAGEGFRAVLAREAETERIVELGWTAGDGEGPVSLLVVRRPAGAPRPGEARVAVVPRGGLGGVPLGRYVAEHAYGVPRDRLEGAGWSLERPEVQRLVEKIRAAGVPLRDYLGAAPAAGVRTGLAEGYVVDAATRERLERSDPAGGALLRPYLRPADLERWDAAWGGQWIVALSSSDDRAWPWTGRPEDEAEALFARAYPALHGHLKAFEDRLRARHDRGRYWWELKGYPHGEWLEGPKVLHADSLLRPQFALADGPGWVGGAVCVWPTADRWLLGLANSPLMWAYLWRAALKGKDDALRLTPAVAELLPIAPPPPEVRTEAKASVERLVELTRERKAVAGEVLAWLADDFGVAQPGPALQGFAELAADRFVDEVRQRLPRDAAPLSPRQVAVLRNAHADAAPRLTAVEAKIAGLERKLAQLVVRAYALTSEEVELMWSTAPPRMPAGR